MRTKIITLAIVTCCWACLNQAQAVPVTIQITGNVTSASGSGLPGTIYAGVTFTGTYAYDTSTSDSDTDPQWGVYKHDAPYGISIVMGGYEFKTAPNHTGKFEMQIGDDFSLNGVKDYYLVRSHENALLANGIAVSLIRWDLNDSTHTALSSTVLPTTAPSLAEWDYNYVEIYGGNNQGGFYLGGRVTQTVLIPEPLMGTLMAIGMFFLRRRR